MGKKSKSNKNKKKRQTPPATTPAAPESREASTAEHGRGGGGLGRLVAAGVLVLGGGFFAYAILGGESTSPSSPGASATVSSAAASRPATSPRQYRYYDSAEEAKPFPVTLPPTSFPNRGIANAYSIAKEIPGVLAQQPCLCGCDNQSDDHASLLDCYKDDHASTCAICLKEAVLARRMTDEGESAAAIREAILRHEYSDVPIGN